jgi:hypothetical protein
MASKFENGTCWTAPNEGSAIDTLYEAFSKARGYKGIIRQLDYPNFLRTNLKVTGAPINTYDWQRLESAAFKVGE